jgi:diguanylate cyclase (GGDEF)-like protein
MKRAVPIFAMLSLCASGAWAEAPPPLTTLRAVAALTNAQASQHMPATFEATVIYYDGGLWVEDGNAAIYVQPTTTVYKLAPGDRVRVRGTMRESFKPIVNNAEITKLGHGALPAPVHPTFDQMISAETDCMLITVRAVVQSADLVRNWQGLASTTDLSILVEGGHHAAVAVKSDDPNLLKDLLDAEVEITGVQSGTFDNKMQQTGILIHVQSWDQVKILKRAKVDPWSIAITPMDRILTGYHIHDNSERQRVHGTITYDQPGVALVLQDGARSVWVATNSREPLHLGRVADAIGFPDVVNGFLTLTQGEVHETATWAPVTPSLFTFLQLAQGSNDGHGRVFDLVSVEGRVVTEVRQATQDEYVLDSDGRLLSAILHHRASSNAAPLDPMREIPVSARIRVTGICMLTDADHLNHEVPFNILMRTVDDIEVVGRPSPLNVRNLIILVALLLVAIFAVGAWSLYLERKRRHEIAAMAYLEQRRSLILEELNGSRPLKEIVEHITDLVTFSLRGAASWCEIQDGPCFGQRPADVTSQRVVQQMIRGRSGDPLGTLFAAIPHLVKPNPNESTTLALGTGLAKVAIETSNLYNNLVYRSEFDLLTDLPNRFSLEKQLETLICEACASDGVFGFIFIDLDRFKEINDRYGHQTGDVYLEAAAQRMKRQLRPGDMLARLGGDEFAVVARSVRNRADVVEIALRLERCFDEPFVAEGRQIYGAASLGIALYPEDATNRDILLSTADTAMYAAKQSRKSASLVTISGTAS